MGSRVGLASKIEQGTDFDLSQPETLQKEQPIIRALKSAKTGDSVEILAKYSGLVYDKKFRVILNNFSMVTLDQRLERYG